MKIGGAGRHGVPGLEVWQLGCADRKIFGRKIGLERTVVAAAVGGNFFRCRALVAGGFNLDLDLFTAGLVLGADVAGNQTACKQEER